MIFYGHTLAEKIKLPRRKAESHKGDYGRILILAGSVGMTGAATLTTQAVLRGGGGLITLAIPQSLNPVLEVKTTCAMTLPLPEEKGAISAHSWPILQGWLEKSDLLILGPGLSVRPLVGVVVEKIFRHLGGLSSLPFVLDADGIKLLSGKLKLLESCQTQGVLTPHIGEFCAISGYPKKEILVNPVAKTAQFARQINQVILLKGHHTVVTDGERTYKNDTGNPGMATGGSGDVLAGLIGAFMAQGLPAWESAVLGAYLHGKAGDASAERLGQISLCATDLLDDLPQVIREHHLS